jgi:RND family efflux transporter MFP subunit
MRAIVDRGGLDGAAVSSSQMGRFETAWLASVHNLAALTNLSGAWINRIRGGGKTIILDIDSIVSPTFGAQEGNSYNGHFGCTCYHWLFVFNQFGDLERCALRTGHVHSAGRQPTKRRISTMQASTISSTAVMLVIVLTVAACDNEQPDVVPQIRAIKTYTVTEVASGQTRKFAGQVFATDSSTLSFQVSGNVKEMRVNQGDSVKKDQVLAVLDDQPYKLDVQAAEAALQKARAQATQASQEFDRQETLYNKGWVAKARLDRAQRSRDAASSQVEYATSKLNLAKRDLGLTELRAPFDGTISRKDIDAFVEVKTGQPVYEIEASGALEMRFDIPETIISRVTLGMPMTVTLPIAQGEILQARITEIGSSAGEANAFPIKAGLDNPPPEVRSGMTVEASILLKEEGTASAYLVPIAAVAPADEPGQGYVFIYDATAQTVKKSLIKGKGASDNFVHVYEGVTAGDIVAAAGVTFLNDGQQVKLMAQQTSNALGAPTAAQ